MQHPYPRVPSIPLAEPWVGRSSRKRTFFCLTTWMDGHGFGLTLVFASASSFAFFSAPASSLTFCTASALAFAPAFSLTFCSPSALATSSLTFCSESAVKQFDVRISSVLCLGFSFVFCSTSALVLASDSSLAFCSASAVVFMSQPPL